MSKNKKNEFLKTIGYLDDLCDIKISPSTGADAISYNRILTADTLAAPGDFCMVGDILFAKNISGTLVPIKSADQLHRWLAANRKNEKSSSMISKELFNELKGVAPIEPKSIFALPDSSYIPVCNACIKIKSQAEPEVQFNRTDVKSCFHLALSADEIINAEHTEELEKFLKNLCENKQAHTLYKCIKRNLNLEPHNVRIGDRTNYGFSGLKIITGGEYDD